MNLHEYDVIRTLIDYLRISFVHSEASSKCNIQVKDFVIEISRAYSRCRISSRVRFQGHWPWDYCPRTFISFCSVFLALSLRLASQLYYRLAFVALVVQDLTTFFVLHSKSHGNLTCSQLSHLRSRGTTNLAQLYSPHLQLYRSNLSEINYLRVNLSLSLDYGI